MKSILFGRASRALRAGALAAVAAAAVLGAPRGAAANGRYPAASLLVVDPSEPDHLIVRATYGVVTTRDHGQEWRWSCESVIGYGGYEDPMLGILADGRIVAGLFVGLSSSQNGGCDWALAGDGLADRYVVDLSIEKLDPSRGVLAVSEGVSPGVFLTQVWETTDSGGTWTQAGLDLPDDFLALTIDPAPSDPERVYLSGRYGAPEYQGVLQRSPDRGQTWVRADVPGSNDKALPYIGAVDPMNPDVVYVRIDGAGDMPGQTADSLLVTTTGGDDWITLFEGQGDLLGFALSPDGSMVAIGGPDDGLWVAPTSTYQFAQASQVGVKCLTWTARGLYACADEFRDGFVVGLSEDEGKTFAPLLHLDGLCGPLTCEEQSGLTQLCTDQWGPTQVTIGSTDCDGTGTGGPSSSSGTGAGAGAGAGAGQPADGDTAGGGCACTAPPERGASTGWLTLILAGTAAAIAARRARRRGG